MVCMKISSLLWINKLDTTCIFQVLPHMSCLYSISTCLSHPPSSPLATIQRGQSLGTICSIPWNSSWTPQLEGLLQHLEGRREKETVQCSHHSWMQAWAFGRWVTGFSSAMRHNRGRSHFGTAWLQGYSPWDLCESSQHLRHPYESTCLGTKDDRDLCLSRICKGGLPLHTPGCLIP